MTALDWKQVAMFGLFLAAVVVLGVAHVIDAHAIGYALAGGAGWMLPQPRRASGSIPPPANGPVAPHGG